MVCKYCGKKIYNTVKAGGVFVSCDLGMVYFNEADQKTLFLGTDGKIHKGAECRKNANGAMLGRKLHGETCQKIDKLYEEKKVSKQSRILRRSVPYAV